VPLSKAQFDCAIGNGPEATVSLKVGLGTTNLDAFSTNRIHLTGPGTQVYWYGPVDTSVTPGGTVTKRVRLDAGITIVHYPPWMVLLGATNRTTVAGDIQTITGDGNGYWTEESYGNFDSNAADTTTAGLQAEVVALQNRCTSLETRCTNLENWMNTVINTGLTTSGYVNCVSLICPTISGSTTITGDATVTGSATISGTSTVDGIFVANGGITVIGDVVTNPGLLTHVDLRTHTHAATGSPPDVPS